MFSFFKNKYAPRESLAFVQLDMHNHLLPGVDDGPSSMEESLKMIEAYINMGWTHIITTPHINETHYPNSPDKLRAVFESLQKEVNKRGFSIHLDLAAEYQTDALFQKHLKEERLLSMADKRVLIELPFFQPPINWSQYFFDAQLKGYTPILAHAERYLYWKKDLEKFATLRDRGVELQLNLSALIGKYGSEVQRLAEKLISREAYSWVASDAHSVDDLNKIYNQLPKKWPSALNKNQYKNNVFYTS